MKAVFVMDMPKGCYECPLLRDGNEGYCPVGDFVPRDENNGKDARCPLRPLPKAITEYDVKVSFDYDADYAQGFNDAIRLITGETE